MRGRSPVFIMTCGLLAAVLLSAGCSKRNDSGDWYDESKQIDDKNRERQRQYMESGMSEIDAHKAASLDYFIDETQKQEPSVLGDGELQERFGN